MVTGQTAAAFFNTVLAIVPGVIESILFGALSGGGSLMKSPGSAKRRAIEGKIENAGQIAAAKKINAQLGHVTLNDDIPF
jgi:hypothetical protein